MDIAELDISDFRSVFISTNLGEISISQSDDGLRISVDGKPFVIKMSGENSLFLKEDKC